MAMTDKGCEGCKFLVRQDNGYSNWTVLDTSLDCLKHCHPAMPLNDCDIESAAIEAALAFGEACPERVAGDGPWLDVDGETTAENYKDDADVYALLKSWLA